MIDLTPIIQALIGLLSALITYFLIPLIKRKADAEKLAKIKAWVQIAVAAAEQVFAQSGMGEEKKEFVVEFLREKGFTLDTFEIDALIEAAVHDLGGKHGDTEG